MKMAPPSVATKTRTFSRGFDRAVLIGKSLADAILASGHVPPKKAGHMNAQRTAIDTNSLLAKTGSFTQEKVRLMALGILNPAPHFLHQPQWPQPLVRLRRPLLRISPGQAMNPWPSQED